MGLRVPVVGGYESVGRAHDRPTFESHRDVRTWSLADLWNFVLPLVIRMGVCQEGLHVAFRAPRSKGGRQGSFCNPAPLPPCSQPSSMRISAELAVDSTYAGAYILLGTVEGKRGTVLNTQNTNATEL